MDVTYVQIVQSTVQRKTLHVQSVVIDYIGIIKGLGPIVLKPKGVVTTVDTK